MYKFAANPIIQILNKNEFMTCMFIIFISGETSDDEKVSRDAEAESRNNLYWCGRYNCACLWYS